MIARFSFSFVTLMALTALSGLACDTGGPEGEDNPGPSADVTANTAQGDDASKLMTPEVQVLMSQLSPNGGYRCDGDFCVCDGGKNSRDCKNMSAQACIGNVNCGRQNGVSYCVCYWKELPRLPDRSGCRDFNCG
jgi:hypothetical protein